MTDATGRPSSRAAIPRWVWPVLVGSLALNMIAAGSMLGQRLRGSHALPPGIAARLAQGASAPVLQELSPERRAEIRAIFERHRGEHRALWNTVRERRMEVTKALEAEPFDKAGYVAAMAKFIEAEATARSAAQPTFADVAAVMTAKERRDFLTTHRQLRQQLMAPARGPGASVGARKGAGPDGDGHDGQQR